MHPPLRSQNRLRSHLLALLPVVLLPGPSLQAATEYWTPSSPSTGIWAVSGGTANWSLTSNDPSPSASWSNGNNATIQRSVSLNIGTGSSADTINVSSLTVESGSNLTLTTSSINASTVKLVTLAAASSGNVILNGSGFAATNSYMRFELNNSFNGTIEAQNDIRNVILLSSTSAGGSNAKINLSGGTLALNTALAGNTVVIGELQGNSTSTVTANFGATAGTRTLEVSQNTNSTFSGTLLVGSSSRVLALKKSGTGTLELTNTNTYDGATTLTGGTLLISGSGSINGTSGVTVNGGTLNYSSSVNLTTALTFTSGTLAGTNFAGKTLSIGSGQTISPGSSTGTLSSNAQTWAAGGTYVWELNNTAGTAGGTGWDLLSINGGLDITATSSGKFTINVTSLNGSQVSGITPSFNSSLDYSWLIADATSAVTGFDATAFTLNLTGFQNSYSGTWAVALGGSPAIGGDNSQIYLTYTAIPEPSTAVLLGAGLMLMLLHRSRPGQIH